MFMSRLNQTIATFNPIFILIHLFRIIFCIVVTFYIHSQCWTTRGSHSQTHELCALFKSLQALYCEHTGTVGRGVTESNLSRL